ncbi:MAG: hypothetical protein M1824_005803 [Vezdaea acicularis]|nr:MAG: hypothetical protein M1824_005803 [Vezdaea acicularis]
MQRLYYSHCLLSLVLFFPLSIAEEWIPKCGPGPSPFSQAQQHLLPDHLAPWDDARGPDILCLGYASGETTYPLEEAEDPVVLISAECRCDEEGEIDCDVGNPNGNPGDWNDVMRDIVEEYCLRMCQCHTLSDSDDDEQSKVTKFDREPEENVAVGQKRKQADTSSSGRGGTSKARRRVRARHQRPARATSNKADLQAYTSLQKHCTPFQMAEECRNVDCGMGDLSSINLNQFRKGECLTLGRLTSESLWP